MALLSPGEAAARACVPQWFWDRLRRRGLIPECVPVGRVHAVPADAMGGIIQRLTAAGIIKPQVATAGAA